jgi:hypothetical protein
VAVGLAAAALVGVTSCGGPRNSLNTDASVCFRSLAVASGAVHHKGKLVGVRRVSARVFRREMPETTAAGSAPVCLVAFQSDYQAGEVADAGPPAAGRYAVVAVATGTPTLLGARVTDRLPLRFRHRT